MVVVTPPLSLGSSILVSITCHRCNAIRVIKYRSYVASKSKLCRECNGKQHSIRMSGENHPMWGKPMHLKTREAFLKCIGKKASNYKNGKYLDNKKCKVCGVKIAKRTFTFLCRSCANSIRTKLDKHWNWKGGKSFEPYPHEWNQTFKNKIRHRDNYKCQLCGKLETKYCEKLSIHHIDYDKKNIQPNNLISLCRLCHIKTNYNRKLWLTFFSKKKGGTVWV